MATKNVVPRANNEGFVGKLLKRWAKGFFIKMDIANGDKAPVHTLQRGTTYALTTLHSTAVSMQNTF